MQHNFWATIFIDFVRRNNRIVSSPNFSSDPQISSASPLSPGIAELDADVTSNRSGEAEISKRRRWTWVSRRAFSSTSSGDTFVLRFLMIQEPQKQIFSQAEDNIFYLANFSIEQLNFQVKTNSKVSFILSTRYAEHIMWLEAGTLISLELR